MKKIEFPLLCFQLQEDSFLGILVGTEHQVVEKSVKKVKSILTSHLQKIYKREGDYPLVEVERPVMKIIEMSVRPSLHHGNTSFPLKNSISVSTPLVYGEEEDGVFDCYLPLFNANFYCYDLRQLDTLARHFMKSAFDDMAPEEIYRHVRYPKPELEVVTLRVKEDHTFNFDWNKSQKPKVLERLAERYPYQKAVRRSLSPLPEAAWEMEEFVDKAQNIIFNQKASLLIQGNPGVGKTAIIKATFKKLTSIAKKNNLKYSFWRIRAQRITATSKYLGEWQEVVEELAYELGVHNGILWVEDVVELLRQGSQSVENSVAAYLLPFLQSGRIQLVGEVTPQQLESIRRLLPGFIESLQVLEIQELSQKQINVIFEKTSEFVLQNLNIAVEKDAIASALRLLERFYPYERFPGKGIRFLGECLGEVQLNKKERLTKLDVMNQFIRRTGLPELFLRDDILLDQDELEQFFNDRIIGQEDAVLQLCDIIKVFKAGLNNPYKPITTLIFAGPTGVGKTASARALADYFFGKGQKQTPLIRIDMSEFQYPSQITRFLGEGRQPGKLVSDVREKPFAVLLLDEAEKAAPSIFDAFLTVLDEGMLVDAFGRITNFRNCIIILTSNLGASNQRSIGFASEKGEKAAYLGAIARFFRPEFINRIDNVVVFNSLDKEHVRKITLKELAEVKLREGFVKRKIKIDFDKSVVDHLAEIGFHEKYGARPLQRALEDHIVKPLAKWLLKNAQKRNCQLTIAYQNGIKVS
ncbi:MAG: AAA family ATPase [Bacteroidota bacterium]